MLVFLLLSTYLTISAQNKSFEVTIEDNGQPIPLFSGFTCTGNIWQSAVAALSKEYECHIFTFAGFDNDRVVTTGWCFGSSNCDRDIKY